MEDRDDKLDAVYEEIEKNMILLGATAIEDKLQDGVPETIANLALAGIKIWVLTGDKQETAINIGYSCRLLTDEMEEPFIIDAETQEEVESQMKAALESIDAAKNVNTARRSEVAFRNGSAKLSNTHAAATENGNIEMTEDEFGDFSLVISGHSLAQALKPELELTLLNLGCMCKAVICCRVTPLQKALVVDLIKRHKKSITLSIGDGANDVSMIKMAHIGIGISGQEGMQAVLSSDYSISQFRYLERLLLVHGRWSYLRMCKFLKYFFYKNFAFTLCHFWFAFFCGFSAQTLFDPFFISLYNVFYTSLPVLVLGVFDQDVNENYCIRYPKLYEPGVKNVLFNKKVFSWSVVEGVISSLVLFFIPYGTYLMGLDSSGQDVTDTQTLGTVVAAGLVLTVNLRCALDTSYWTGFNHFVIWGSIIYYFCFHLAFYSDAIQYKYSGVSLKVFGLPSFWFCLVITSTLLILPMVAYRFYTTNVNPTLSDRVRLRQRMKKSKSKFGRDLRIHRASTIRRSTRSMRSGYAFAHQAGFGELITSGINMKDRAKDKNNTVVLTRVVRSVGEAETGGSRPGSMAPSPSSPTSPPVFKLTRKSDSSSIESKVSSTPKVVRNSDEPIINRRSGDISSTDSKVSSNSKVVRNSDEPIINRRSGDGNTSYSRFIKDDDNIVFVERL